MVVVDLLVARGVAYTGLSGSEMVLPRAAPERICRLACNVTRMEEWSPERYCGEGMDGATGARFGVPFPPECYISVWLR